LDKQSAKPRKCETELNSSPDELLYNIWYRMNFSSFVVCFKSLSRFPCAWSCLHVRKKGGLFWWLLSFSQSKL